MERNQNGYPTTRTGEGADGGSAAGRCSEGGCGTDRGVAMDDLLLAYAYVPVQKWRMLYSVEDALGRGTMFEELDKPMEVYGNEW